MRARYYINSKQYDKALSLTEKGKNENPFIYYSEVLKSQDFSRKRSVR